MQRIAFLLFCSVVVGTAFASCPLKIVPEGGDCTADEECANNYEVNSANGDVLGGATLYCLFDSYNSSGVFKKCQMLGTRLFGSACNSGSQCTSGNTCWMVNSTMGFCQNSIAAASPCVQYTMDNCPTGAIGCGTNPCTSGLLCLPPQWGEQYNSTTAQYNCSSAQNCTCQSPPGFGANCTTDQQCQYQQSLTNHAESYAKCQQGTCNILGTSGMGCSTQINCLPGLICAAGTCALQPVSEQTLNATTPCSCASDIPCPAGTICTSVTAGNLTMTTCVIAENLPCASNCSANLGTGCGYGGVYYCVNNNCSLPNTAPEGATVDNALACGPGLTRDGVTGKCVNITGMACTSQEACWGTGQFVYCNCEGAQTSGVCTAVAPVSCDVNAKASTDFQTEQQFCCAYKALPDLIKGYYNPAAANIDCSTPSKPPLGIIIAIAAGGVGFVIIVAGLLVLWRKLQLRRGYEEIPMMSTRH